MFAGKTDILLKEISRAKYGGNKIQAFKPAQDDRWNAIDEIRSHSGGSYPATAVQNAVDIIPLLQTDTSLVAIDEIQFFDQEIVNVVEFLLGQDIRVIFAGLSLDFRGEPFGSMPQLLALCDEIDRPSAICKYRENGKTCGKDATKTQRFINGQPANYHDPIVLIGAEQEYQARCPNHHVVPGKPKLKI
ncbi:MAG: thymidine kinase [Candidatus Collierbacteria bacterium GW2011_GWB1_45_35]|uniref:Thymidine kinase n=2 Tax=Candidatus Collieribacteriota TaxID=1752725 RepID=A0A837IGW3_9BACT|nr:MAG: thymidine kinase [Microgenomates group bacterium GW2011_GWC1_44_23]KKT95659.1 MAG: thymidine kinase [Candidatus Collierbacteria bacterium GW2011_GWA1_45_15]KKU00441.1 MAG: thymidine kinase [Candidatus Collierbacteria bacterium GW2011_GWB2_45_17]KKU05542.1 MAG: thymidine kinase [Candidatus Collierbacteria bacterium GW2011_GWB1_45_35]KKU08152.1 MAG: thymidine kinase [Candidatus Collierbacteria bacterium GW2011_GWC2_45_40]